MKKKYILGTSISIGILTVAFTLLFMQSAYPKISVPPPVEEGKVLDNSGHDKEWWQAREKKLVDELAEKVVQLEEVRRKWYNSRIFNRHTEARTHLKTMEALENELADLQKTIEVDLPKEARKAGAYPGWLRGEGKSSLEDDVAAE